MSLVHSKSKRSGLADPILFDGNVGSYDSAVVLLWYPVVTLATMDVIPLSIILIWQVKI